jgi:predicted permease
MSRLLQDLRFAVRSFAKAPGFTAVAIVVLALGIGANSATFTIVNALLFRPVPTEAEDIVGLYRFEKTTRDYHAFAYPNFVDVRDNNDVFDSLAAHTFSLAATKSGESTKRIFVELVTSNYFDTLRVPLAAGRTFRPEEERPRAQLPVVIASYDRWAATGFDPGFLGSTMPINAIDFTIVGVAPQGFTGTMALVSPEAWLPLGMFDTVVNDMFKNRGDGLGDRKAGTVLAIGRLKPGITMEAASARLNMLSDQIAAADPDNRDQGLSIARLPRMSSSSSPQTDTGLGVVGAALMGLAGTVLLIACLNLANMLMARGTMRKKEIAIRLALGGARSRIIRQLLTESMLLAIIGAGAGLMLAYWSTALLVASFARVLPLTVVFESKPDMNVMLATIGFVGLATILAGVGPALKLSRLDLVNDLKDQASDVARPGAFTARNVLVVTQLALSLGLLTIGGLFARSAYNAARMDPGFTYDGAILAALDPSVAQIDDVRSRELYRSVLDRMRSLPGVEAASLASTVPFGNFHEGRGVERPGVDKELQYGPTYRIIGADYFRSLGMPLLKGREFTGAEEQSAEAPRVAIIDEALAKQLFEGEDPVGQTIRFKVREGEAYTRDTEPYQIVGVSANMREELIDQRPSAHIYVPYGRFFRTAMNLHVKSANRDPQATDALLETIRRELRGVDARLPVLELTTFRRFHDQGLELWGLRMGGRTMMIFGLLALGLAVAGVYGVKSYLVSRRTREIGIRMAIGARPEDVVRMVMRESLGLTLAGLAVGLPIARGLARLLGAVVIGMSPFDPTVFIIAPLSLAIASMVASYIPARRATHVNPLSALRAN